MTSPVPYRVCPACRAIYPGTGAQFCPRDGQPVQPNDRVIAGEFILGDPVGSGAMGEVFRAEQPRLGRAVAIKLLRAELLKQPEMIRRFEREAQAAGALSHPGIVTVYQSGRCEDGRYYLAMELLAGEPLSKLLQRAERLALPHALRLWTQMLQAMREAHRAGVVHRDLKPDNLFVVQRGEDGDHEEALKILDFGIAKIRKVTVTTVGTAGGAMIGTYQYMAPEQLEGREADPRSDVYALALILYEMLTGQLPWGQSRAESYELFALRLTRPPLTLRALFPACPPALEALLTSALARDPAERPRNAAELLQRARAATAPQHGTLPGSERGDPHGPVLTPTPAPLPPWPPLAYDVPEERTVPHARYDASTEPPPRLPGPGAPAPAPRSAPPSANRDPLVMLSEEPAAPSRPSRLRWLALLGGAAALLLGVGLWRSQSPLAAPPVKPAALPTPAPTPPGPPPTQPAPPSAAPQSPAPPPRPAPPASARAPLQVRFEVRSPRGLEITCATRLPCSSGLCSTTLRSGDRCTARMPGYQPRSFAYDGLRKQATAGKVTVPVQLQPEGL